MPIVEDKTCIDYIALKRKYGATIEDILIYREKIADELDQLLNRDERIGEEQEKLNPIKKDLEIEANELSIIRQKAAKYV